MRHYDAIILGAGSMGLAAGYALARDGRRVLLLDRYTPPHSYGSHSGETRLLRVAYVEGGAYVPMARRARALWLDITERERPPAPVFAPTGVLSIVPPGSREAAHLDDCIADYHLDCERIDAAEAMRRWPVWSIPQEDLVYRDAEAGVLRADWCLEMLREACLSYGAEARFGGQCEAIALAEDGLTLRWDGEEVGAERLILAAGAGTGALLARFFPDVRAPLQPKRKVVAWYAPAPGATLSVADFPPFFMDDGAHGLFYGFSDDGMGVKVGRHDGGIPCTFDTVERDLARDDIELTSVQAFLRRRVAGIVPEPQRPITCLYTLTPDEDFIIDTLPSAPQVAIAAGFSGHGFKFAPAVGEVLAALALGRQPTLDLAPFRLSRFTYS